MEQMNSNRKTFFTNLFLQGESNNICDYEYAGGDQNYHYKYSYTIGVKKFPYINYEYEMNVKSDYCICGHPINENCYLTNRKTKNVIHVGNCCIKKFLPGFNIKRCLICDTPTKYMKGAICSDCRRKGLVILNEETIRDYDMMCVHFGKYKGKNYQEFLNDLSYCQWLLAQGDDFSNQTLLQYLKYKLSN